MELENDVVDTQVTEAPATSEETSEMQDGTEVQDAQPTEVYKPFASGKEKFVINGVEEEWDWETARKYAQLGKAGQRAMEKAAALEKKQKDLYAQLRTAAEKDPDGFLEVITGKRRNLANPAAPKKATALDEANGGDPKDLELKEYYEAQLRERDERLSRLEQRLEQEDVERERKLVAAELDDAIKKYPVLNTKHLKAYVQSQYRQALVNGLELSLEDVAFYVSEEVKQEQQARQKTVTKKLEENNKRAPVFTPPAPGSVKKKGTLEDSLQLGGVMPS